MAAPRVSIRYAKSLIGLASERGVLAEVERDVRSILTAIEDKIDELEAAS
jgi:F0F1-type ATP synthase delta subunit